MPWTNTISTTHPERHTVSSGSPWEPKVGYSRGVRMGQFICISGTTAVDENGHTVGVGDPYMQTKYILEKIETALKLLGASMHDVVRTRMYVTNIGDWERIGQAHGEVFEDIRPASTLVEVSQLISPDLLVEIEVDAHCVG